MTFCGKSSSSERVPCPTMRHGASCSDLVPAVALVDAREPAAEKPSASGHPSRVSGRTSACRRASGLVRRTSQRS
jgi:hypothetical protein